MINCFFFQIPVGVVCNQGDLKDTESAPVMSHQFTAGMEKVTQQGGTEIHRQSMQIYSDFSAQILRLDMDLPEGRDMQLYGGRPVTYIYDYHTSKLFNQVLGLFFSKLLWRYLSLMVRDKGRFKSFIALRHKCFIVKT